MLRVGRDAVPGRRNLVLTARRQRVPCLRGHQHASDVRCQAGGINWGGGEIDGVPVGVLSPFPYIENELGDLTVSATGFTC